ncbi:MAG: lytic transglycosylase, partial [Azorhizobium sp. 39-67-5]
MSLKLDRRTFTTGLIGAGLAGVLASPALAQSAAQPFPVWVQKFRARAQARGISDQVYDRVFAEVVPDKSVYAQDRAQPEFQEQTWQYLNRRVS